MSLAIGTFIDIEGKYLFQNFFVNTTRKWEGKSYQFAGFWLRGCQL